MKLILKGEFCDLNTYINAERTSRFKAAKIKKEETERVCWECKKQKLEKITSTSTAILYDWYVNNKKKDPSNIAFAKKFIEDGLVMAGVLENDGWKNIVAISDVFWISKDNPRVEVTIL